VFSLLAAIGSVTRHRDNNVAVAVGSEIRFLDVPEHTDPDVDTVVDSRYVGSVAREAFDPSGTRVSSRRRRRARPTACDDTMAG
jgi:hypothetical protein